MGYLIFFVPCAFASVHCCIVVTCWERADLLALVGEVYCDFVTFPFDILGQVWYLNVSIPEPCCLFTLNIIKNGIFATQLYFCQKRPRHILQLSNKNFTSIQPTPYRTTATA